MKIIRRHQRNGAKPKRSLRLQADFQLCPASGNGRGKFSRPQLPVAGFDLFLAGNQFVKAGAVNDVHA